MNFLLRLIGAVVACAVMAGCASNRATANVDGSAHLEALKSVYVRRGEKDHRGIEKLIAQNLRQRGMTVTTGDGPAPAGADATVTYVDKWMWDITMYMLELTVQVREPKTDYPLASGNSRHTSLTRKSPQEMVDEVLGNIFTEGKHQ
jgi:hypothetical protein